MVNQQDATDGAMNQEDTIEAKLEKLFEGREQFRKPSLRLLTTMYVIYSVVVFKRNSAERNTNLDQFEGLIRFFTELARERCDHAQFIYDLAEIQEWLGPEEGAYVRKAVFTTLVCMRLAICEGQAIDSRMAQVTINAAPTTRLPNGQRDPDLVALLALQPEVSLTRNVAIMNQ